MELCEWVLSHPDREQEPGLRPSDRLRENPPWGECRRAVGDLLGNLVKAASVESGLTLPDIARGQLLTLLCRLCTEYDWPLDEDRRVFIGREDWASEAINNTRSRALWDLLRYGRWLRREDPDADVSEITETLEDRFAPDAEFPLTLPERTIASLGYLDALAMDEEWALEHHPPYRRIYEIFEEDFHLAIRILPQQAEHNPALSQLLDVLGQRLVTYGASGMFPLRGEESPLEEYYQATDGRRQHWADLFEHVGRRLYHVEGELDEVVRQRYENFFEWRLEVGDPVELARFDSWLEAGCLSIEWRLDAYSRALDVCQFDRGSFWHHWAPLSGMIPEHTGRVVECFAKLVDKFQNDAYITPVPAKRILRAGLASDEPEVRENAERALEILLANGQFDISILDA